MCRIHQARILLEVELVGAHRTNKGKQELALFDRCVTEGHEKASEVAKYGAMMAGGEVAQIRANTVLQKGRRLTLICKAQGAPSFSLFAGGVARLRRALHRKKMYFCGQEKEKLRHVARSGVRPRADANV